MACANGVCASDVMSRNVKTASPDLSYQLSNTDYNICISERLLLYNILLRLAEVCIALSIIIIHLFPFFKALEGKMLSIFT